MKASIVDLRYRMSDVLRALDRNEDVIVLCHGKLKGILSAQRKHGKRKVSTHPFFNMRCSDDSVTAEMEKLRGGRYRAL